MSRTVGSSHFSHAVIVAVGLLTFSGRADAATMGFSCITQNNAQSCGIGQSQLTAELVDLGNGSVEFLFKNQGSSAAAVTQIYFDQPSPAIMGLTSMTGSNGVSFRQLTSAGNLPAGQGIGFVATSGVGARPPTALNGINQGEWLRLAFTLSQGSTFASLLTSLATGDLRIGMHVQSIGQYGNSEAFVNEQVVPEPTSMLLLGTGLAAAAARRRRRRNAEVPATE